MVSRSVLLITLGSLIAGAVPTAAGAVTLGPSTGLTAAAGDRSITVTFTPAAIAAARLRTGSTLEADCQKVPPARGLAFAADSAIVSDSDDEVLTADGTLGADGTAKLDVETGLNGKPALANYDACELDVTVVYDKSGSDASYPIGEIGLNAAGVSYADESDRAVALRHALIAAHQAAGGYKPATAVAGVTPLAAPGDSVPAGTIGYWTDGRQAVMTTTSAAGRRLLLADRGDLTLASNVFDQSDPFGAGDIGDQDLATLYGGSAGEQRARAKARRDPERDGSRPKHVKDRTGLAPLPGLRVTVAGRRLSLRFTGAAAASYRAIAGRKVRASCMPVFPRTLFPSLFLYATGARQPTGLTGWTRVARHGGRVAVDLRGARDAPDICVLTDDGVTIATFAGTRAGRTRIQDVQALTTLYTATRDLKFAPRGATAYRPTAAIVAGDPKHLVALTGPNAVPPVGRVGVWTDGAQHATIAVCSAAGTRYAYADEGDGLLATNVLSLYTPDGLAILVSLDEN